VARARDRTTVRARVSKHQEEIHKVASKQVVRLVDSEVWTTTNLKVAKI
jgi:hypothetical protein